MRNRRRSRGTVRSRLRGAGLTSRASRLAVLWGGVLTMVVLSAPAAARSSKMAATDRGRAAARDYLLKSGEDLRLAGTNVRCETWTSRRVAHVMCHTSPARYIPRDGSYIMVMPGYGKEAALAKVGDPQIVRAATEFHSTWIHNQQVHFTPRTVTLGHNEHVRIANSSVACWNATLTNKETVVFCYHVRRDGRAPEGGVVVGVSDRAAYAGFIEKGLPDIQVTFRHGR